MVLLYAQRTNKAQRPRPSGPHYKEPCAARKGKEDKDVYTVRNARQRKALHYGAPGAAKERRPFEGRMCVRRLISAERCEEEKQ